MKKLSAILIMCAALASTAAAQTVNFSEHISPIIYNNCAKCHRPGEVAPFPLTSYSEVASRGQMIKYVTGIRYMPPWMPDRTFSRLLDERYLTDEQIKLIADWVDAGTPQGDPRLEAPLPNFPSGSQLGKPDLVLSMSQSYAIQGNNQDEYRIFVFPTGLIQDRQISAVEFRPGNKKIVHHTLIAVDTTGQGRIKDQQDPGYGYAGFGGFGGVVISDLFPGYVPGATPRFFPDGIGQRLPKNADLLVQIHYAPSPIAASDSSSINIFFARKPVTRYLQLYIMLPFNLINGPFVIPPNEVKQFHGVVNVPFDVSLLSLWPHCHLLGKSWEVYFEDASGKRTNLLRINNWNFNWQGSYLPERLIKIPAGSTMHAFATYDNTTNNPSNPNNPPQQVTWGEKTTDEMYFFPLGFVTYQPGDENIDLRTEVKGRDHANIPAGFELSQNYPNPLLSAAKSPARGGGNPTTAIKFALPYAERVQLIIYDLLGRKIATLVDNEILAAGQHARNWEARNMPSGVYFYQMTAGDFRETKKMILMQ
ncbi:T9SS type A sorting domain-containing protein [candidate division KSB1 bacterium]|nr:T9SS type A sorting domain-containing protein [candidate division KSB1 bacterium]